MTPWRDSRFWLLQIVVLVLYLGRLAAFVTLGLHASQAEAAFTTATVFLVPVILAALNFGFRGAICTSVFISLLSFPELLSLVGSTELLGAWELLAQLILLDAIAFVVGQRVTSERLARGAIGRAEAEQLQATNLYRVLFDSNASPILIVDAAGNVVDMNEAARRTFRQDHPGRGHGSGTATDRLVDVIGAAAAGAILTNLLPARSPDPTAMSTRATTSRQDHVEPMPFMTAEGPVLLRPTVTKLDHPVAGGELQVVFENVTAETLRHERMEAYAAHVVLGQEEERRHLAQELHDGPLQTLIHLCRQIDEVGSADASADRSGLDELRSTAEATVAELRIIARGLRPSVLDDLGIEASIRQMVDAAGERAGVTAVFSVSGASRRLPPAEELTIFRIAQEAISNIERHAAATRFDVSLAFSVDDVELTLVDDGIGFDGEQARRSAGLGSLGLTGMSERAHLVNAKLLVDSTPGHGTRVSVMLPLGDHLTLHDRPGTEEDLHAQ